MADEYIVTQSGMLEEDEQKRIRLTDNSLKEGDPVNQPPQDPKPLELGEDGLPLNYKVGE